MTEKDIILILGGGGMSGAFTSGVLKAFESKDFTDRLHAMYATSVGACVGARFLVQQSEIGGRTSYMRFNGGRFIKK